jgi:oxepin-CoA hydrolase / 3-oxo-5,6-dehydrosuberyl-CoA semialdehyde dehydrogenase
MPFKDMDEAIRLSKRGKGSLCSTIVTSKDHIAKTYTLGAATHHGRILLLNRHNAKESTGHGSPLPMLVHGGPGRAGGGEEMGGARGVKHYMQRAAIQGSPDTLTAITSVYQAHAIQNLEDKHPFRKYFEELQIGDSVHTHRRTITEADISQFANISWDHFYAHTDHGSLEGTMFEKPVAHGYFILSAAAGLFVDAAKGPVLLNYGIEECRFLKPVYAGTTIGVRFTCKEKTAQDLKDEQDIPKGIVKWYVDVYDDTGDSVMIATILTMVRKKI